MSENTMPCLLFKKLKLIQLTSGYVVKYFYDKSFAEIASGENRLHN